MDEGELVALNKYALMRWAGIILIIIGIFFDLIGVVIAIGYDDEPGDPGLAVFSIGMCTIVFVLPGIALYAWGYKTERKEGEEGRIIHYLRSYSRIKISDLAKLIGKTEPETEQLVVSCIGQNLVMGHIDSRTKEFIQAGPQYRTTVQTGVCPMCNAPVYDTQLYGDGRCTRCGAYLSGPPPIHLPPPVRQPGPPQGPPQVQYHPPPPTPVATQTPTHPPVRYPASPQPHAPPGPPSTPATQQYPGPPEQPPVRATLQPAPKETGPAPPAQSPPRPPGEPVARKLQVPTEKISTTCPECSHAFEVVKQPMPFAMQCPHCGAEGTMEE